MNSCLTALSNEAWAAKAGLRLLARACLPLLERCRLLAAQKRLLTKWQVSKTKTVAAAAAISRKKKGGRRGTTNRTLSENAYYQYSSEAAAAATQEGTGASAQAPAPDTAVLVDGLRALVAALSRDFCFRQVDRSPRRRVGGGSSESDEEDNVSCRTAEKRNSAPPPAPPPVVFQRPLVSLRAVGIASVAVQRLVRLARNRSVVRQRLWQRQKSQAAMASAGTEKIVPSSDENHVGGGSGCSSVADGGMPFSTRGPSTQTTARSSRSPLPSPDQHNGHTQHVFISPLSRVFPIALIDHNDSGGVIPIEQRGGRGAGGSSGGIRMLGDEDVLSLSATTALTNKKSPVAAFLSRPPSGKEEEALSIAGGGGSPSAATRCLGLLSVLVVDGGGRVSRAAGSVGGRMSSHELTLLEVLAAGQVGHWRRLEERGVVPSRLEAGWNGSGSRCGEGLVHGRASRVIAGRYIR